MTQVLELADFSGGMTDNYIDGDPKFAKTYENLYPTNYNKARIRHGSALYDNAHQAVLNPSVRIRYLYDHESILFLVQGNKLYHEPTAAAWSLVTRYGTADALASVAASTGQVASGYWNGHLLLSTEARGRPRKAYKDGSTWRVVTAGLPLIGTDADTEVKPTNVAAGGIANSNIYAFHYVRSYAASGVTYQDFGPVTYLPDFTTASFIANPAPIQSGAVAGTPNNTFTFPVFANTSTDNYDVSSALKIYIYRTINNGNTLYKVAEIANGTTSYHDTVTDDTILNGNFVLYTDGGNYSNDPPPLAKYVTVANDTGWYLNVTDSTGTYPNRLAQSIQGDIDSCPGSFFTELEVAGTGLGFVGKIPIAFCADRIYRIDGIVNADGSGLVVAEKISQVLGCVSNNSIVNVLNGCYFASNDGFYFTDGYQIKRISFQINDTYKQLVSDATRQNRISGTYNVKDQVIHWTCTRDGAGSSECNVIFSLDISRGVDDSMPFVTQSGSTYRPTALAYHNSQVVRAGDNVNYGCLFKHDPSYLTDQDRNGTLYPIIYTYTSCAFSFTGSAVRKWVSKVLLTCTNLSNLSINVTSNNNDGHTTKSLAEIRDTPNIIWGQYNITWGDPDVIWNYSGILENVRRFPAKGLRTTYKQITATNSYTQILKSDDVDTALGKVTIAASGTDKLVTFENPTQADWPTDSVGYFISTETDGYVAQLPVTARSADTLTVDDPNNLLAVTMTGVKWVLSGYRKGDVIELLNVVFYFLPLSPTQNPYRASSTAGNT